MPACTAYLPWTFQEKHVCFVKSLTQKLYVQHVISHNPSILSTRCSYFADQYKCHGNNNFSVPSFAWLWFPVQIWGCVGSNDQFVNPNLLPRAFADKEIQACRQGAGISDVAYHEMVDMATMRSNDQVTKTRGRRKRETVSKKEVTPDTRRE